MRHHLKLLSLVKETVPGVRHWCLGRETGMMLTGMERPVRVLGGTEEEDYFELLGAVPLLGWVFSPGATEADLGVVLSEGLWR